MFHALLLAAALDAAASPTPSATPSPTPAYSLDGSFSLYSAHTNPEGSSFTDVSNGTLTLTKNTGVVRANVTLGDYAFPTLGTPFSSTTQPGANTSLYGWLPEYALSYVPSAHVTFSAGQLPSLLGQESGFTYQNINVQRGVLWAAETTFSRGARLTYSNGKWSGTLGYDDGYYSGGRGRALEGLVGWTPTSNTTLQLAFTVPGANTPGNITSAVANKREYDLMLTQQYGKLQLLPYVLFVKSPASTSQGYARAESATGFAMLADYAATSACSLAFRFESFQNASGAGDLSPNADLVGFGAGSGATTWTITPTWHPGPFFARVDFSNVSLRTFTSATQNRIVGELGVQF